MLALGWLGMRVPQGQTLSLSRLWRACTLAGWSLAFLSPPCALAPSCSPTLLPPLQASHTQEFMHRRVLVHSTMSTIAG